MAEEIALFIDFENIRYSMINTQHREPDPQELINVARRYGTVMVAKAYADWSRQPEMFKGSLTAAMIDRVDCPAKLRDRYRAPYGNGNGNSNSNSNSQPSWSLAAESAASAASWVATAPPAGEEQDADTREVRLTSAEPASDPASVYPPPHAAGPTQSGPTQSGTQSTVDLNMLMDIIETVFDRPSISTFVLMTGDRDFTRICARLKLRLNKFVVVAGVPGTVSRDLTAAANQFVLLGNHNAYTVGSANVIPGHPMQAMGVEPADPQFLQFLDYIDRHWAWRTIIGVSNFIGDPYNHKNRFRGRLTRESARDLLQTCIQQGILIAQTDAEGNEDLRLNRSHPVVEATLAQVAPPPSGSSGSISYGGSWAAAQGQAGSPRRTPSIMSTFSDQGQTPMETDDDEPMPETDDDFEDEGADAASDAPEE